MNTFIEIKSYATQKQFNTRGHHDNRLTNLSSGKCKDEPYINLVEKYAAPVEHHKDDVNVGGANSSSKKSRSEYTNEISMANARLKKYEKQLEILEHVKIDVQKTKPLNLDKLFVASKKYDKKISSIEKLKAKIMGLEILRDGVEKDYSKSNSQKNRHSYVEFTLTITDVPSEYKRDVNYRNNLKNLINEYIAQKGFKFKKSSSSIHMDQSNPHMHLLASYDGDNDISQDIQRIYGKKSDLSYKNAFYNMQLDFNKFVKEHQMTKNLDWKIDDIQKGGAKDYVNLALYKSIQENASIVFDRKIASLEQKNPLKVFGKTVNGLDYEKIYKTSRKLFKKEFIENTIRETFPLKNEDEIKAIYAKREGRLMKSLEKTFEAKERGLKDRIDTLMDDKIELKKQNREYKERDATNATFTDSQVKEATLAYEKEIKTKDEKISSLESSLKSSVPKSELDKYKKVVKDNDLHSYFDEIGEGNPDYKNKGFRNR